MRISTWFEALHNCQTQGIPYVLITVITTAGSTPRENGCKMIVTPNEQFDTIGGGHLEYDVVNKARKFLLEGVQSQNVVSYPLSSKLGQCCGGAVKVLFEVFIEHHQSIAIFGAGHVAAALVPILSQLPLQIAWIDSRAELFDNMPEFNQRVVNNAQENIDDNVKSEVANGVRRNVNCVVSEHPVDEISSLPLNTWVIILTHNHQLDYELVETCLKSEHISFVGMIGSDTKAKRFCTRLAHKGFSKAQIDLLNSPIGDRNIPGKKPIEVAVSISAQIIQKLSENRNTDNHKKVQNVHLAAKEPMQ